MQGETTRDQRYKSGKAVCAASHCPGNQRWLPRENCLIYVDIMGREFRRIDPDTGFETRWPLEQMAGSCFETSQPGTILLAQETRPVLALAGAAREQLYRRHTLYHQRSERV